MSTEEPPRPPRGLSRRQFIGATIGVAAIAGGVPLVSSALTATAGELVSGLLATPGFTVAHRGGSDDWPEMSLFAYQNSVAHGVNALEVSLARTSDGVWFGLHDKTLDRTSGTTGYIAAKHSWAEIKKLRITAAKTTDPSQASQPYVRFDELADAFARTHTMFVDPKVVPARYFPELLGIMGTIVRNPTQSFIAKGYCTSIPWAIAARARGYRTWGYYYGSEVEADPALLTSTQANWNLLGMDFGASTSAWNAAKSHRKKVIGHIIETKSNEREAIAKGAAGLVVAGVTQVLG